VVVSAAVAGAVWLGKKGLTRNCVSNISHDEYLRHIMPFALGQKKHRILPGIDHIILEIFNFKAKLGQK
jgi:hypothetical protein